MNLDAYKIPAGVRDGTWIALDHAPEVLFHVRLPGRSNRQFNFAMMDALPRSDVQALSTSQIYDVQLTTFKRTCIDGWQGLNGRGDFTQPALDALLDEYPMILTELWQKAQSAAGDADRSDGELVGNSPNGWTGTADGPAESPNTN